MQLAELLQLAGFGAIGIATAILVKCQNVLSETAETLAKFQTSVADFRDEVRDLRAEVRELRDLNDEAATRAVVIERTEQARRN